MFPSVTTATRNHPRSACLIPKWYTVTCIYKRLGPFCSPAVIIETNKNGHNAAAHFSAYVYCGQTAGWIKMPLGTVVGLDPCNIVLDGDPAFPKKGHSSPPLFDPCLLWPNNRSSQQLLSSCFKRSKFLIQFDMNLKQTTEAMPPVCQ